MITLNVINISFFQNGPFNMLLNYYGAHAFFLPGAHSMLKPALGITLKKYTYITCEKIFREVNHRLREFIL